MTIIKLRRGASTQWTVVNPVLQIGEPGYESDTGFIKIGNGTSTWAQLPYFVDRNRVAADIAAAIAAISGVDVTAADITDSTSIGRAVLTASTTAAARSAIGAGTSSFDGSYTNLTNKPTLGTAAAKNTGTAAGTVSEGDHVHNATQYGEHLITWNGTSWVYNGATISSRPSIPTYAQGSRILWDTSTDPNITTFPSLAILGDAWRPHPNVIITLLGGVVA